MNAQFNASIEHLIARLYRARPCAVGHVPPAAQRAAGKVRPRGSMEMGEREISRRRAMWVEGERERESRSETEGADETGTRSRKCGRGTFLERDLPGEGPCMEGLSAIPDGAAPPCPAQPCTHTHTNKHILPLFLPGLSLSLSLSLFLSFFLSLSLSRTHIHSLSLPLAWSPWLVSYQ